MGCYYPVTLVIDLLLVVKAGKECYSWLVEGLAPTVEMVFTAGPYLLKEGRQTPLLLWELAQGQLGFCEGCEEGMKKEG